MSFAGLAEKASAAAAGGGEPQGDAHAQDTGSDAPSQDLAPESDASSAEDQGADSRDTEALTAQDIIDLDKLEKFRLHGEEWTRDKLASAMLRQADYTRKTQEFAKERKYYDNLAADIRNVLRNPQLVTQFKKIYPEKFHRYLDHYEDLLGTKQTDGAGKPQKTDVDQKLLSRIDQIENRFKEQEVKAAEAMLDGVFSKYTEKFPFADEASVISKALALMETRKQAGESDNLSESDWNRIFQGENDRVQKLAESRYQAKVKNQLQANRKAKDVAAGGDAPSQAPKRLSMKEATEAAIRDLTNARG